MQKLSTALSSDINSQGLEWCKPHYDMGLITYFNPRI